MTLRFRKRINIGKLLHFTIGKTGVGISLGPRGMHVGRRPNGTRYVSMGIPGTGIYGVQEVKRGIKD